MRRTAAVGGALILLADGFYLWAISQQGASDGTLRVPFVAAYLAVWSCRVRRRGSSLAFGAARAPQLQRAGTLVFGVLGIFSIGLLLVVVSIPLVVAVLRSPCG